jgi:hypothetical protein
MFASEDRKALQEEGLVECGIIITCSMGHGLPPVLINCCFLGSNLLLHERTCCQSYSLMPRYESPAGASSPISAICLSVVRMECPVVTADLRIVPPHWCVLPRHPPAEAAQRQRMGQHPRGRVLRVEGGSVHRECRGNGGRHPSWEVMWVGDTMKYKLPAPLKPRLLCREPLHPLPPPCY